MTHQGDIKEIRGREVEPFPMAVTWYRFKGKGT